MACFDNIVGLSRTVCPCEADGPEGYNDSESGLYITDLEPLSSLDGFGSCDANSAWTLLSNARDSAVKRVKADLIARMSTRFKQRAERFSGAIGEGSATTNLSTSATYAGVRMALNPVRGGTMTVRKIGTIWPSGATAGNLTISVYNSLNVLVGTRTVTIVNTGRHNVTTLTEPLVLPTFTEYSESSDYFFLYTFDQANPARRNKVRCNCGGFDNYYKNVSLNNPAWMKPFNGVGFTKWVMPLGWTGNALDNFHDDLTGDSLGLNGLTFDVEFSCNYETTYCPGGTLNFDGDPVSYAVAHAVQFAAGIFIADKIFSAPALTRNNTINRDLLKEMRAGWINSYNEAISYIADNANPANNDCLVCRPGIDMKTRLMRLT